MRAEREVINVDFGSVDVLLNPLSPSPSPLPRRARRRAWGAHCRHIQPIQEGARLAHGKAVFPGCGTTAHHLGTGVGWRAEAVGAAEERRRRRRGCVPPTGEGRYMVTWPEVPC